MDILVRPPHQSTAILLIKKRTIIPKNKKNKKINPKDVFDTKSPQKGKVIRKHNKRRKKY